MEVERLRVLAKLPVLPVAIILTLLFLVPSAVAKNLLGLNDRHHSPQPSPGVKRILLLGQNAIVGVGLEAIETPGRQLETKLTRTEVIHAAVPNQSLPQVFLRLKELVRAYSPDQVIIYPEENFWIDYLHESKMIRNKDGEPERLSTRYSPLPTYIRERPSLAKLGLKIKKAYFAAHLSVVRRLYSLKIRRAPDAEAKYRIAGEATFRYIREIEAYLAKAKISVIWIGRVSSGEKAEVLLLDAAGVESPRCILPTGFPGDQDFLSRSRSFNREASAIFSRTVADCLRRLSLPNER